jgi:enediyne biosynthesis protein E4
MTRLRAFGASARQAPRAFGASARQALAVAGCVASCAIGFGAQETIRFTDVTHEVGIDFLHINGSSPDKHVAETVGSGGLFFDYDNDGWIDIFLVDGGSLADPAVARKARHRLYHNRGNGTFEDVTARSNIQHSGYGMGACAGDVDNDGWIDLYVTGFGGNVLYRNRGDGTFADVTRSAGVGASQLSASCAFADFDKDGDLDLFVANYVDLDPSHPPFCGDPKQGIRSYCHPLVYRPMPNTLYRNDGPSTQAVHFTDVSVSSGIAASRGYNLGVVVTDYDGDSWPDIFVANDSVPNLLFRNNRNLRFVESALGAGVAVATDAKARAGMGVDAGDYDGDGRLDLVVTNLDFETTSLFRSLGDGLFAYATGDSGIGFGTLPFVGFGAAFLDADNDGRLDLAIANGHIFDNAPLIRPGSTYAQRKLLFHNTTGRRFAEVGRSAGPGFALEKVGRSLAYGDIDNDGDLDLLVTNNGQTADVLRNDSNRSGSSILVRALTAGTRSHGNADRDAIGAVIRLTAGSRTQVREIRAGSSYLTQHDLRAHFGLDGATRVDRIDVLWPSGRTEVLENVAVNQIITVGEGRGILRRSPLIR